MNEIERKFLLDRFLFEDNSIENVYDIEQFYTSIYPETRFRKVIEYEKCEPKPKYYITHKSEGTLSRTEVIYTISEEYYLKQKKNKIGNVINKRRYIIKLDNKKIAEVDLYINLNNLKIVEVEFEN